jgi:cytidine deaminase
VSDDGGARAERAGGPSIDTVDWDALRDAAAEARERAYAPYSGFAVGAALVSRGGQVFTGCNVENASYGLSLCAERSALAAAITSGAREYVALAIVAPGPTPASPCGMCRQVLSEFPPGFPVRCYTPEGTVLETSVAELLPHPFGPGHLDDR